MYIPQEPFIIDGSTKENIAIGVDNKNINEDRLNYAIEISSLKLLIDNLKAE